jgi:cell division septal protein FtsQ
VLRRADVEQANIFLIDTRRVADQVRLIPHVKDARVQVGLPNHVRIRVVERQPVLNYVREGETFWVDDEGHIFQAPEFRIGLPVLLDDDSSAMTDPQHMDPALAQAIIALSQHMPELDEFRYRSDYGLYFITPEGWRVLMGDGERMDEKLRKWRSIRQQLLKRNRQVKIVDLRFENVYVR